MHRKMLKKVCICFTVIMTVVVLQFSGCISREDGSGGELAELTELTEAGKVQEEISEVPDEVKESTEEEPEEQEKTGAVSQEADMICVHVCGSVVDPGVYRLPSGSRLYEAVDAAGGLCEDAAEAQLNQASLIEDGQQIYVPSMEEAEQGVVVGQGIEDSPGVAYQGGKDTEDDKLNLNTASKEQLMTLNGVGEAKAAAIIRYREEHGGFQKIEDLMEVEGIKEGVFNKVKDQIKI